ncbi:FAD-dependent oxidoreductase [Rhodococcus baikonurensis]|uniref:FAD-dependent oxidoreductase n=1 Tax=Rhodococcus baikonurensis TaxID=172041 RepID=UPI000BB382D5|nr:NADH oxidase [Rhodococcus erythropolis]
MTTPEKILVIGADAAGMSAAHQILREAEKRQRHVHVAALEKMPFTSYSACGIPYWVAGDVDQVDSLVARTPERHRTMGVDLRTGLTAVKLDTGARTVTARTETGNYEDVQYDQLVIATGGRPVMPEWVGPGDGALHGGVAAVKDLNDGRQWIDHLTREFPNRNSIARPVNSSDSAACKGTVVVIGGSYIGLEMAEAAMRRGFAVTLLTRSTVMSSLDADMSVRISKGLNEAGVHVVEQATVDGIDIDDDGWVTAVRTRDGAVFPCELVVVAMGVRPSVDFAREAGLAIGRRGGLTPDSTGAIAPGIWAAGDCCESLHRISENLVYSPLGTHANKQGRIVGTNVMGGQARFGGVLGTSITRFVHENVHLEVSRTGLSTTESLSAGFDVVSKTTEGRTASGYMPEASPIAVKILADRGTRRLLGGQIVGGRSSAKRIDTIAAALWNEASVDDLAAVDLSYAPPFATVWEIVQLAARRLADSMQ